MRIAMKLGAAVLALCAMNVGASAISPAENRINRYAQGPLPDCASPAVLGEVVGGFQSREDIYWGSGLRIGGFDHVRQRSLRPWGPDFVPRRFCTARAHFNDGRPRHVNYFVRETIGPLGNLSLIHI